MLQNAKISRDNLVLEHGTRRNIDPFSMISNNNDLKPAISWNFKILPFLWATPRDQKWHPRSQSNDPTRAGQEFLGSAKENLWLCQKSFRVWREESRGRYGGPRESHFRFQCRTSWTLGEEDRKSFWLEGNGNEARWFLENCGFSRGKLEYDPF